MTSDERYAEDDGGVMEDNGKQQPTMVAETLACLDKDLRLLSGMLQRDCEALRLPFPRYGEYRERVVKMGQDVQLLTALLAGGTAAGEGGADER